MKPTTKAITFNYLISEDISLEVNAIISNNDLGYVMNSIKDILGEDLAFATYTSSEINIPCSGFYAETLKDRYLEKLSQFNVTTYYTSNTSEFTIKVNNIQHPSLKSIMFNNQNILPILETLNSLDKILDAALEETKKTFEQ